MTYNDNLYRIIAFLLDLFLIKTISICVCKVFNILAYRDYLYLALFFLYYLITIALFKTSICKKLFNLYAQIEDHVSLLHITIRTFLLFPVAIFFTNIKYSIPISNEYSQSLKGLIIVFYIIYYVINDCFFHDRYSKIGIRIKNK